MLRRIMAHERVRLRTGNKMTIKALDPKKLVFSGEKLFTVEESRKRSSQNDRRCGFAKSRPRRPQLKRDVKA